ncbi:MAG TPA: Smr/MutS family protein [Pyrinomonadaceae bacterium]|jgi:dsDNA-specific endonuclease/ATPase MutS2
MRLTRWLSQWLNPRAPEDAPAPQADEDDVEDADVDPFNPFPEPVSIEIRDTFDLHSIAPRDVRRVVEEYLLEARQKGFPSVRIIHGKGVGVQREIVRSILAATPFVEHYRDAPPEAGGWGATIARLSSSGNRKEMMNAE